MTPKAETYRALAEGCRRKAARASNAADRTDWLGLADAWLKLLEDMEQHHAPRHSPFVADGDTGTRH
jgi:hypothetical protein